MDNITRAYARNKRDEKRLRAADVPTKRIYRADRGVEAWGNWKMRKGERCGVVDGLLAFGTSRKAMMAALYKFEEWGALIVDVETGLCSDRSSAKLLDIGLARHHGERAMKPGQAKEMNEASVAARTKGRMPQRSALVHWRNPALKNYRAALKRMPGWTRATAYNILGRRDVPVKTVSRLTALRCACLTSGKFQKNRNSKSSVMKRRSLSHDPLRGSEEAGG